MPNKNQLVNIIVPIVTGATAVMAKSWGIDPASWQADVTEWVSAGVTLALLIYNHYNHATPKPMSGIGNP